MTKQITTSIVLAALSAASPVAAQDGAPPAPPQAVQPQAEPAAQARPMNMADLRHHVYVMERALAGAVDYGAKQLNREISNAMPGVFMLEGDATARGMYLEGYGVFFDVRVPMMRQSMVWSMRMLMDQNQAANQTTINELRKSLQGVTDPTTRANIERAVRQLERNVGATPVGQQVTPSGVVMPDTSMPAVGAAAASGIAPPRPAAPSPPDSLWVTDPNRAYTQAVTRALVDAMIDYSAPMIIPADQWLTVAARDDEGRDSLAPQDPLEEVVTMIYRIKGSDLQLYRAGKIDRDEVRKRVQVTQF
jgi:hypothetical protein